MVKTFTSKISNKQFPVTERISLTTQRRSIFNLIKKDFPDIQEDDCIATEELNVYREKYIAEYLKGQLEELTQLERNVLDSIKNNTTLSDKLESDDELGLTFGQRIADRVASFGGSWTFIILFGIFIFAWIGINIYWLANKGFDPYPFILLNLILSCLAALQAPVIMMSQNRQEEKDRQRAKMDYMINLKSELEIRTLHEKVDHLIMHQQQELLEIQKVQIEMMSDILNQGICF